MTAKTEQEKQHSTLVAEVLALVPYRIFGGTHPRVLFDSRQTSTEHSFTVLIFRVLMLF